MKRKLVVIGGIGLLSFCIATTYRIQENKTTKNTKSTKSHDQSSLCFLPFFVLFVTFVVKPFFLKSIVGRRRVEFACALARVLFSYTFFFEEYTGLAITVLCILTLFIVMQFTGRVDWDNLFGKSEQSSVSTINA